LESGTSIQLESDWSISDGSLDTQELRNRLEVLRDVAIKILVKTFIRSECSSSAETSSLQQSNPNDTEKGTSDHTQPSRNPGSSGLNLAPNEPGMTRKRRQMNSSSEGDQDAGCIVQK